MMDPDEIQSGSNILLPFMIKSSSASAMMMVVGNLFQALGQWGRIGKQRGTSDERGLVDQSPLTESLQQAKTTGASVSQTRRFIAVSVGCRGSLYVTLFEKTRHKK